MRTASITRKTAETDISVEINLDGTGAYDNQTGVGFFDHMLESFGRHALFDLDIQAIDKVNQLAPAFVLTGGDLKYFDKIAKSNIFANSNLLLLGLKEILEYNAKL